MEGIMDNQGEHCGCKKCGHEWLVGIANFDSTMIKEGYYTVPITTTEWPKRDRFKVQKARWETPLEFVKHCPICGSKHWFKMGKTGLHMCLKCDFVWSMDKKTVEPLVWPNHAVVMVNGGVASIAWGTVGQVTIVDLDNEEG